jgi:UDP-N-acetylmuramate--alanine ligase
MWYNFQKIMKIHFAGIGGVGMAALAALLKWKGKEVDGCDLYSTFRTKWLESLGISVHTGHDPSHVVNSDIVVVTSAMSADEPEMVASQGRIVKRGEMLARIVSEEKMSIAVCGTHGKTTTSTYIAKMLSLLGENVIWAIGGECGDFPVAGKVTGSSKQDSVLVVEADESDGTLAFYKPSMLVVTNCDYDHPDHFKTVEEYRACFDAAKAASKEVVEGELLGDFPPLIMKECGKTIASLAPHNRRNARTAVEVALRRGHNEAMIAKIFHKAVESLPDRRFERIVPGVYMDYAHHPVEMKCAVAMARAEAKGKVRVLFQPHRYSRTKAFLAEFPEAFSQADEVILCPTYAAFEKPIAGGDVFNLYDSCRNREMEKSSQGGHAPVFYLARNFEEAWKHVRLESRSGDLILILGAGDIVKMRPWAERDFPDGIKAEGKSEGRFLGGFSFFRAGGKTYGGGEVRIAGVGSNTWISDLSTDEEYLRPDVPASAPGSSLGIPWMAGIPGSIGGWIKMNAGAFGHSISEVVRKVKVSGKWIDARDCGFGYRQSAINGVVEDVEFDTAAIETMRKEFDAKEFALRRKKFPPRCCGSVFKNPPGDTAAGKYLERVGAKGMRVGKAYVWESHANVIALEEGGRASDVLALAGIVRAKVKEAFGVELEAEIRGLSFN